MLVPLFLMCLGTSLSAADSSQAASYSTRNSSNVNIVMSEDFSNNSAQEPSSSVIKSTTEIELDSSIRDSNNSDVNSTFKVLPKLGASEVSSVTEQGTSLPTAAFSQANSSIESFTQNSNFTQQSSSFQKGSVLSKDGDILSVDDSISRNKTSKTSGSVARKGTPLDPLKEELETTESEVLSTTSESTPRSKPPTSKTDQADSEDQNSSKTGLIVGLSFGMLLLLALAYVAFWRFHEVWTKRQYKRVDFLVDGLYIDS